MKVIGRKKRGLTIVYLLGLVAAIFLFVFKLNEPDSDFKTAYILLYIIMGIVCICCMLASIFTSKNIILYDEQTTLYVEDEPINLADIVNVSYTKARAKYITYAYGSIQITTKYGVDYTASNVKDCEEVAQTIIRLVYEKTNNSQLFAKL